MKKASRKPKRYLGGCLCGSVRFEAVGEPEKPHTCSCRMCQQHTGSLTAAWVEFPKEAVTWTGSAGMPATWRSSDFSSRAFCSTCGSSVGAIDDNPVVALLLGAFDNPNRPELRPAYHSNRGSRPKWWRIECDAPTTSPRTLPVHKS
ncbi:MAG: GFA family protein [Bosea sp.]|nr:GFA family protein [Bosea sp. (in: a-proteobacteria)]